ncbi:MAG: hypothetical protein U0Q04_02065 [Microbacterium sp.]
MTAATEPLHQPGTAPRGLSKFYRSVLGGDLAITAFSEFKPTCRHERLLARALGYERVETPSSCASGSTRSTGPADGLVLMVSTPSTMESAAPTGFSVSVSGDEAERLQEVWDGLADGGAVTAPYTTPPWTAGAPTLEGCSPIGSASIG